MVCWTTRVLTEEDVKMTNKKSRESSVIQQCENVLFAVRSWFFIEVGGWLWRQSIHLFGDHYICPTHLAWVLFIFRMMSLAELRLVLSVDEINVGWINVFLSYLWREGCVEIQMYPFFTGYWSKLRFQEFKSLFRASAGAHCVHRCVFIYVCLLKATWQKAHASEQTKIRYTKRSMDEQRELG